MNKVYNIKYACTVLHKYQLVGKKNLFNHHDIFINYTSQCMDSLLPIYNNFLVPLYNVPSYDFYNHSMLFFKKNIVYCQSQNPRHHKNIFA